VRATRSLGSLHPESEKVTFPFSSLQMDTMPADARAGTNMSKNKILNIGMTFPFERPFSIVGIGPGGQFRFSRAGLIM